MKFTFVFIGKTREPFIEDGVKSYIKRLKHYIPLNIVIVRSEPIKKGIKDKIIKDNEAGRILKVISPGDFVVALDKGGKGLSSVELADFISRHENKGISNMVWIIGGPLGISEKVLLKADMIISLSHMTFTHEMSRLILSEQLYRAMTIKRGEKYHK